MPTHVQFVSEHSHASEMEKRRLKVSRTLPRGDGREKGTSCMLTNSCSQKGAKGISPLMGFSSLFLYYILSFFFLQFTGVINQISNHSIAIVVNYIIIYFLGYIQDIISTSRASKNWMFPEKTDLDVVCKCYKKLLGFFVFSNLIVNNWNIMICNKCCVIFVGLSSSVRTPPLCVWERMLHVLIFAQPIHGNFSWIVGAVRCRLLWTCLLSCF